MSKNENKRPIQSMDNVVSGGNVYQRSDVEANQNMKDIKAEEDVFQEILSIQPIDLNELALELNNLRQVLITHVDKPAEQYPDIQNVHEAAIEAEKNNGSKALAYLSKVGTWVIDVATKIGTTIAAEAIKQSIGLGKH